MASPNPKIYLINTTGGIITNQERAAQVSEMMGYRRVSRAEYQKHMQRVRAQEQKRIEQEQSYERYIKHHC